MQPKVPWQKIQTMRLQLLAKFGSIQVLDQRKVFGVFRANLCNVRLQKLQYICEELLEQNLIKLAYSVMLTFMFGRYTFVMRMYSCKRWRARRQQYSQGKKKELYPKYLAHKKRNLEAFCPT